MEVDFFALGDAAVPPLQARSGVPHGFGAAVHNLLRAALMVGSRC